MADFPISPVVRRVVYTGSAGTGPYAFTFEILAQTDIDVYVDSTLKTLTTDYTVSINANGTGSVTFVTAPGSTTRITIVGARDITRASDYVTGGDFTAASLNVELDQQTIFNQQNAEALGRAILAPVTDPASINMVLPVQTSRAGKILAFDSTGNPTVGEEIGNWRGNWAAGQAYTVRDLVKDASNANVYRANTAHTSSGTTPISSNADVAKWDLVVDAASAGASAAAAAASASAAASSASAASTSASNASTSATNAASSASAASTSASNASTSATNASNSASSASSSASTATTQASNASTSASNAATSATSASNSASTATTQATNASNSASAASTSATNAASSASAASTSASNASTSATNASNSASTATTQATNSANSATASAASAVSAASSAASAAALLDNFDDRYLGAKTSDPSVDNDGNALLVGALYFNTTDGVMKVYTASGWIAASSASVATLATFEFVATAGQTVFTGADANSATLSYVAPALIVTLNGVRLRPGDDYTATNGTSITLVSAAALNDELVVDAFGSFLVANTYTIAEVDAFAVKLTGNQSIAGNKNFAGNTLYVDDTNDRVGVGTASPSAKLHVVGGQSYVTGSASAGAYSRWYNNAQTTDDFQVGQGFASATDNVAILLNNANAAMVLGTNGTERMRIRSDGGILFQPTGGGTLLEHFGTRAWVRKNSGFDGLGDGIMGSGGVSSLTSLGTGRWQVNLSITLPDTNYAVIATSFRSNSDTLISDDYSNRSTTMFTLNIYNISIPPQQYNFGFSVAVIR
jgi:hypothetical protein